jgi:hypothetical protein
MQLGKRNRLPTIENASRRKQRFPDTQPETLGERYCFAARMA